MMSLHLIQREQLVRLSKGEIFMSKQSVLLHLLTSAFFLTACQVNEEKATATANEKRPEKAPIQQIAQSQNGVMLKIEKKQYKASEKDITVTTLNKSDVALTHGEPFAIKK